MDIVIEGIDKSFGATQVLRNVSYTLSDGGVYCLMGPSGVGKTTLFRIILGLEYADRGSIKGVEPGTISAMFQEDRLCETLTAVENVALVMSSGTSRRRVRGMLEKILPGDCMKRPVMQLSGGMRRRVALARAVAYPSRMIVLDEPFTGLDGATKRTVIDFLLSERCGRTLLVSSHNKEDVGLLGGEKIVMENLSRGFERQEKPAKESGLRKEKTRMIDSEKTMKEIVESDPLFGEFLVHKGFPFTLDNPVVEFVTFNDVVKLRELDHTAFLEEYEEYRIMRQDS